MKSSSLPTALPRKVKSIGSVLRLSVRPSVRPSVSTLSNRLTFELEFCVYVDHDQSSPDIKSQGEGQRSMSSAYGSSNAVTRTV